MPVLAVGLATLGVAVYLTASRTLLPPMQTTTAPHGVPVHPEPLQQQMPPRQLKDVKVAWS